MPFNGNDVDNKKGDYFYKIPSWQVIGCASVWFDLSTLLAIYSCLSSYKPNFRKCIVHFKMCLLQNVIWQKLIVSQRTWWRQSSKKTRFMLVIYTLIIINQSPILPQLSLPIKVHLQQIAPWNYKLRPQSADFFLGGGVNVKQSVLEVSFHRYISRQVRPDFGGHLAVSLLHVAKFKQIHL